MPARVLDTFLDLPFFDGFPYWITRVVPAMYHVTLLPPVPTAMLAEATQWQATVNQLPTCLVLAKDRARYVDPKGYAEWSRHPPRGGNIVTGELAPVLTGDPASQDLRARTEKLRAFMDGKPDGAFFGDLSKGGRRATPDELRMLGGFQPDFTPRGLRRCVHCGDWAGTCLDSHELFRGQVMTVHCRCDNQNRCVQCGGLLHERKLNANFYNPTDRGIWHVPGFCAFQHRCSSVSPRGSSDTPSVA